MSKRRKNQFREAQAKEEGTLEVTYRTAPRIGSASGAAERFEVERLNSPEVGGL